MELSDWFKGFEKGISCLTQELRASFFSECAKNCVKCGTLQIYQELYEKANGDLDTFFSEINKLPGVKSECFGWIDSTVKKIEDDFPDLYKRIRIDTIQINLPYEYILTSRHSKMGARS